MIHGLDVTVALGVDRTVPERVGLVLAGMKPKNVAFFGTDLSGVSLEATDLDWRYGEGEPVRGTGADLLLVVCGRKLPAGRLRGRAGRPLHRLTRSPVKSSSAVGARPPTRSMVGLTSYRSCPEPIAFSSAQRAVRCSTARSSR